MQKSPITVAESEYRIITNLIDHIGPSVNLFNTCITRLKEELEVALILPDQEMPQNVIRLNSIIDIETPFGQVKVQLVLPDASNSTQKRISILTPMGSALLGYATGDEIVWDFPTGTETLYILNVSAPNE